MPTRNEQLAQQWHEDTVETDPLHEQFSSCWCCCWSCDPDARVFPNEGNPYYAAAVADMHEALKRGRAGTAGGS